MPGSEDDKFSEYRWVQELTKEVEEGTPMNRMKALELLGKYLGLLQAKGAKPGAKKVVEFDD